MKSRNFKVSSRSRSYDVSSQSRSSNVSSRLGRFGPRSSSEQNTLRKKLKFEKAINTFFYRERTYIYIHTHTHKAVRYYAQKAYLQTSIQTTWHRI